MQASVGRGVAPCAASSCAPCCSRPLVLQPQFARHHARRLPALPLPHPPASSAAFGASSSGDPAATTSVQPGQDFKPFPRLNERDPYRLLGLGQDAAFEEVQDARNYLYELYRWHEPSREAIEHAYERVLKEKLSRRHKYGFQPIRTGRRGDVLGAARASWAKRWADVIDPTITARTLINEGSIYAALAMWAMFATDQSFPLAAAFAYCVYRFQSKRVKADPEGPYFGGNPVVGAIITTVAVFATACGIMAALTTPLAPLLGSQMRQVGTFLVVMAVGVASVYIK